MATVETALITAAEYGRMPDNGQRTELVRGRIVPMNMPAPRHGQICGQIVFLLKSHLAANDLGHVVSNDSGVLTERDPDTVRGGDVAFYSYRKVPKGPLPEGYLPVPPDLVFEVRSPDDRWNKILAKVAEYLNAGVSVVCVLDPAPRTIHVYPADQPEHVLEVDDNLELPSVLGSMRVPVRSFFE